MRNIDAYAVAAALLLSTLVALQAIDPLAMPPALLDQSMAQCADGSFHLAMGCETIYL